ncbi:hybrid sensor histidine kinase/response regulator [Pseudoalteromonas espejiana]
MLEKSKQSNQLKDKFVARLSSQLNAPITSLQSIIALAKGNNSNSNNYLKEIESASKQLKSVAQQLVNVNKSDSDKLKLKISTINLNELLNNSADIVNKEAENTNLIINNKLNENEGIMSDEKLIMQLVLHLSSELLENSYKGLLTLNTELTHKDSKHYLSLNFLINNLSSKSHFFSQLKHIAQSENFEKMDSIDATLEVKFFMSVFKMLGGKSININERGKTTSINLSLLVNEVALTKSKAINKQNIVHLTDNKPKTTSKSLLLVDDEPLVEMVIKAMLKNENLNVDYASSAIEAMLMVSQNDYDIILMDIVMPETFWY